jgi:pilus assembly protein CpaB
MRGRVLILVGLIILGGVAVAALLLLGGGGDDGDDEEADTTATVEVVPTDLPPGLPTPTPPLDTPTPRPEGAAEFVPVVVAVQDIPRGLAIQEDWVDVVAYPPEYAPETSFASLENVVGRIARTRIPRDSAIVQFQLVDDRLSLGEVGSDVATLLEPDEVLVSVPLDRTGLNSVAHAMQPGDSVDVVMSFLFIDVDEEFQTRLPNVLSVITTDENGRVIFSPPTQGRVEFDRNIPGDVVLYGPSEDSQRPRLVTQRIVRNARVLWINWFPADGVLFTFPTPTPFFEEPPPEAGPTAAVTPTVEATEGPIFPFPEIMSLAVSPQDALVLTWAVEAGIPLSYYLLSARATNYPETEAVTLRYIIDRFDLPQPEELRAPFAVEPPIFEIERFDLTNLEVFNEQLVEPQSQTNTNTQQ